MGGAFLIVDDEPLVGTVLRTLLRPHGGSVLATSAAEARAKLGRGSWRGFLIDVMLPDGSGLDVLATARKTAPKTPSVVMSGTLDRRVINRAAALDARFLCKPWKVRDLEPFLEDAAAQPAPTPATPARSSTLVARATERARRRWDLSVREVELVGSALRQEPRAVYLAQHKMSPNTFKTHVRRLLDKTDYASMKSLVIDLLADSGA